MLIIYKIKYLVVRRRLSIVSAKDSAIVLGSGYSDRTLNTLKSGKIIFKQKKEELVAVTLKVCIPV